MIVVGLRVHVNPAGETALVSATVPVNPLRLFTLITGDAVPPTNMVIALGIATMLKSPTANDTLTGWESVQHVPGIGPDPLVPVTVTT